MHTFSWPADKDLCPEEDSVRIHHDEAYDGTALIIYLGQKIRVPCEALIAFVAEFVASRRITDIEQMNAWQVFGLEE